MPLKHLTIFHTNDLHNRKSVFSYLGSVKREQNILFLDGGDAIGGSNTLFHLNEPILKEMSRVGYNAMAMGNREFNYLRFVLRQRYRSVNFPILSANLRDLSGKTDGCWKEYTIVRTEDMNIGITGLTPVQFQKDSFLTKLTGFLFSPPEEALQFVIKKLRELEVNMVVVLSHLGFKDDKRLAKNISGMDIIIGGHSHSLIEKPVAVNNTYIFQTGCYGENIGKIDVDYDCEKSMIDTLSYEVIPADGSDRKALYSYCKES